APPADAEPARDASASAGAKGTQWRARDGGALVYDARAHMALVVSPSRGLTLTGECATGTGLAPVSIYGLKATARGVGAGAGFGARVGYVYRWLPVPGRRSMWWGLRVASGVDIDALSYRAPTLMPPVSGQPCVDVQHSSYEVTFKTSPALMAQTPLDL